MTRRRGPTVEVPGPAEPLARVAGLWLAFAPDTPEEAARRRFRQRYGCDPARVVCAAGLLLLGPLPGHEVD